MDLTPNATIVRPDCVGAFSSQTRNLHKRYGPSLRRRRNDHALQKTKAIVVIWLRSDCAWVRLQAGHRRIRGSCPRA